MTNLVKSIAWLLLSLAAISTQGQTQLFFENFESGNGSWSAKHNQYIYGDTSDLNKRHTYTINRQVSVHFADNASQFWGISSPKNSGVSDDHLRSEQIACSNTHGLILEFDYFNGADKVGWGAGSLTSSTQLMISYFTTGTAVLPIDTLKQVYPTWQHHQLNIPYGDTLSNLTLDFRFADHVSNAGVDNVLLKTPDGSGGFDTLYFKDFDADNGNWSALYSQWEYGDSSSLSVLYPISKDTTVSVDFGAKDDLFWGINSAIVGGVSDDELSSVAIPCNYANDLLLEFDYYNGPDLLNWGVGNDTRVIIRYDSVPNPQQVLDTIVNTSTAWQSYAKLIPQSHLYENLYLDFRFFDHPSNFGLDNVKLSGNTVGIAKTHPKIPVRTYPNPVHSELHLDFGSELPNKLSIFSTDGRLILQKECNTQLDKLDLSQLPEGVYFLYFHYPSQTTYKKIVKQ